MDSPTIDELEDTSKDLGANNEKRVVSYNNNDYQTAFTVSSAGTGTLAHNAAINGTNYTILTPVANNDHDPKTGAVAFNQQIDMTQDWDFEFNIDLTRLNSAGSGWSSYGVGDFIGLVLLPTAPSQLANAGGSIQYGGGLGINGLPNSLAFGLDFWNNSASQDPNSATYTPKGFGDSSLGINPSGGLISANTAGTQVLGWRSTGASGLLNNATSATDQ